MFFPISGQTSGLYWSNLLSNILYAYQRCKSQILENLTNIVIIGPTITL